MLVPLLTGIKADRGVHGVSMERFYRYCGISRQGFFKQLARFSSQATMLHEITSLVTTYRSQKDRRAGSRQLYYNLDIRSRFNIGVTKFEKLLSEGGLSLAPLRVRVVTTRSSKQSWNYPNLTQGLAINNINELVVGDLCYVKQGKYRYYLFCLTDVCSARIVGYHLGERMRAVEAKKAFDQWVQLRGTHALKGCIHHTDGGSQYFSELYLSGMEAIQLQISVAENCLENGYAEQRNGLLKHHLLPTLQVNRKQALTKAMNKIMYHYNYERKQQALGWLSPVAYEKKLQSAGDNPKMVLFDNAKKSPSLRNGF